MLQQTIQNNSRMINQQQKDNNNSEGNIEQKNEKIQTENQQQKDNNNSEGNVQQTSEITKNENQSLKENINLDGNGEQKNEKIQNENQQQKDNNNSEGNFDQTEQSIQIKNQQQQQENNNSEGNVDQIKEQIQFENQQQENDNSKGNQNYNSDRNVDQISETTKNENLQQQQATNSEIYVEQPSLQQQYKNNSQIIQQTNGHLQPQYKNKSEILAQQQTKTKHEQYLQKTNSGILVQQTNENQQQQNNNLQEQVNNISKQNVEQTYETRENDKQQQEKTNIPETASEQTSVSDEIYQQPPIQNQPQNPLPVQTPQRTFVFKITSITYEEPKKKEKFQINKLCDLLNQVAQMNGLNSQEDLKAQDYLYFPINLSQAHWISVVVNLKKKIIYYFDSYYESVEDDVKEGIFIILKSLNFDRQDFKFECKWNKQQNGYDCGVFILLSLLYTYQEEDNYSYNQQRATEFRNRILYDLAIVGSQTNLTKEQFESIIN
ncbi:unnamed protein product (macronuclear) [Paramecium tetraurelia]|uniref:Ubiquitin-like protease family profile domain-containing protein n=1 Tax=Paramecium tetraurelia TaxID=5888 RepID=A0CK77_PARTE|nr:uncharacterized protein GSPATT00000907001 [Paramecium tetraurelia]CAK71194.1 unnamed protein product [Paramecium tetraurelia]|eukprot:XP_001438591.1 hypothetical protein (macronuclear) [Paramecium tetraurelia strain d4-2]